MIKKKMFLIGKTHTKETIQVYDKKQQYRLHEAFPANETKNKAIETEIMGMVFDVSKNAPESKVHKIYIYRAILN